MKTRIVHTKIWSDSWFLSLSRASKILFLYLITNERIGLSGIYEIPEGKIMYETGLTSSDLEQAKKDISEKATFHRDWVKIHNIDRYQSFTGSKNEIAKEKEIKQISPEVIDTLSIPYRYPIDSLSNHKSEIRNKKEGGVGETKDGLTTLDEEFCTKLAEQYRVSLSTVVEKRNDLVLYCKSTGKKYKDYRATLQNWLRKDLRESKK